jgi:hypothetical protein
MLVEALEWRGLQRQLGSCRRRDSVYHLVGCCVRKSAGGDLFRDQTWKPVSQEQGEGPHEPG